MPGGRKWFWLMCASATVLVADVALLMARTDDRRAGEVVAAVASLAARRPAPEATTTTVPVPPTTVAPAPPPTEPPPPPPAPPVTVPPPRADAWTIGPYQGVGVWLDVYDWTNLFTNGAPRVQLEDIDRMADLGIQTLFIQTAHRRYDADIIEGERLGPIIDRAHARGMAVVGWYLPMLEDVPTDLRRLTAASQLPIDGVAVDIESLAIADPALRNQRLLELSTALRQAVGPKAMSAIVQSPVVMQVVNPNYWPGFPWPELGQLYDVIQPMSYWSERKPEWKSGERVTTEDIDRIRASTGRPDMPIHVAGGIANGITLDDVAGMVRAIQGRGVLGGSLYDWNTSQPPQWDLLRILRVG